MTPARGSALAQTGEPGSVAETELLLARARQLTASAQAGRLPRPLAGMNLGLLSDEPGSPPAGFFIDAATELGASVAHVKPRFRASTPTPQAMQVARLLGKLYDAVEWQIGFDELVPLVRSVAEVPVYKGLALPAHPVSSLADRLDPTWPAEQRRRRLLQAALLASLGKG